MNRRGVAINSWSPHLIAQREKLFSLVSLLLQATAELLIYLQPLEYGAPTRPTSSEQQQKLFPDAPSSRQLEQRRLPGERLTNRTDCNEVRAFGLSGL